MSTYGKVCVLHRGRGGGLVSKKTAFEVARELRDECYAETDELAIRAGRKYAKLKELSAKTKGAVKHSRQIIANLEEEQISDGECELALDGTERARLLMEEIDHFLKKEQKQENLRQRIKRQKSLLQKLDAEKLSIAKAFYRQIGAHDNLCDFPMIREVEMPRVYLT